MFEGLAIDGIASVPSFAMRREKKINWVEAAVENTPGKVAAVADAMGVVPATVYTWIDRRSISHLTVEQAVQFCRLTRIDLGKLTGIEGLSLHEYMGRGGRARNVRPARKRKVPDVPEKSRTEE